MKNIHILPTDKPSRLLYSKIESSYEFVLKQTPSKCNDGLLSGQKNIYITSDEEIKEGDWCYYLNSLGGGNIVCQAYKHSGDKRMLFDNGRHNRKIGEGITPLIGECKKIILTTDPTLIADGVQAIDDEFLEWFVKNPSCQYGGYKDIDWDKIIIPKEELTISDEAKQRAKNYMSLKGALEPKQETLEEAAARHFNKEDLVEGVNIQYVLQCAFVQGAKWQAERMYSEEEVLKILLKQQSDYRSAVRNTSPLNWVLMLRNGLNNLKRNKQ